MSRIALFIDGAYFDYILRNEFGLPKIDFEKLANVMSDGVDILRSYYYHCPPYQSDPPTEEERKRFSAKEKFFYNLTRLPRFQVRRGKLEFRGIDSKGHPIFEQKRIDILLGVDMVLLAAKHAITHACLLAGDSDFLPAVQAAKNEGVLVHLFHGARTTVHEELFLAADERTRIDNSLLEKIRLT
ncbi:MAG: NYN domain-containing protein [Firmicutes bacterium]|nr:NYN domain-containing protein [Bacillota bacterium]